MKDMKTECFFQWYRFDFEKNKKNTTCDDLLFPDGSWHEINFPSCHLRVLIRPSLGQRWELLPNCNTSLQSFTLHHWYYWQNPRYVSFSVLSWLLKNLRVLDKETEFFSSLHHAARRRECSLSKSKSPSSFMWVFIPKKHDNQVALLVTFRSGKKQFCLNRFLELE